MDAPKCKICGTRHYGTLCLTPPAFKESPELVIDPKPARPSGPAPEPLLNAIMAAQVADAKFDRVAYQREYMRKWRALRAKSDPPSKA